MASGVNFGKVLEITEEGTVVVGTPVGTPEHEAWRPPLCHSSSQAHKTSTQSHTEQSLAKPGVAQFSGSADARHEAQVVTERVRGLRSDLESINPAKRTSLLHGQAYLAQ